MLLRLSLLPWWWSSPRSRVWKGHGCMSPLAGVGLASWCARPCSWQAPALGSALQLVAEPAGTHTGHTYIFLLVILNPDSTAHCSPRVGARRCGPLTAHWPCTQFARTYIGSGLDLVERINSALKLAEVLSLQASQACRL